MNISNFFVIHISLIFLLLLKSISPANVKISTEYVGLSNSTVPVSLFPKDDLVSGDQFGHAVALWEDICLVSATKRGIMSSQGRVDADGIIFVFQRNDYREWKDTQITLASYLPDDGFGESLSLYETTAVVGAPTDDSLAEDAGYAYIYFTISGGNLFDNVQRIYADKPEAGDYFGYSVAIIPGAGYYSHGAVVVGAYGHNRDPHVADSGSVFIFANSGSTWYQATVIQPSQPYASGYFGWSVSGYGNVIAVGAPGQEAVYVYHMEGVAHECPHDGPPDQMPSACQEEHPHRGLQGAPGGPEAHSHTYSLWEYVEVLHIQNDLQSYKGDYFGGSVSITNDTNLFLAIGAPYDNDGGKEAGAVIVTCLLPEDDIWSNWAPEQQQQNGKQHRRHLQGGAPPDDRDHSQNIWKIRSNEYTADKDGSYWMKMTKRLGTYANEMYGFRTAISSQHLLVGTYPGPNSRGRAELLVFNKTNSLDVDSPVYKGNLYKREWVYETPLFDYNGGTGDYFGSAVALHEDTAVIGGYLTGFKNAFTVGTGGAYIFDAYQVTLTRASGASTSTDETSNASANSVSVGLFLLVIVVALAIVVMHSSRWLAALSPTTTNAEKDLDISVSSVDTEDMNSRHPLQKESAKKSYKYREPQFEIDAPAPAGKYRGGPSQPPSRRSLQQNQEDEEEDPTRASLKHAAQQNIPARKSKTAKYLQASNTASASYGRRQQSDEDSDSDQSLPRPTPKSSRR